MSLRNSPIEPSSSNDEESSWPLILFPPSSTAQGDVQPPQEPGPSNTWDISPPPQAAKRKAAGKASDSRQRVNCPICPRNLLPSSMNRHILNSHLNLGAVPCRLCNKMLSREDALRRHLNTCGRMKRKKKKVHIPLD